MSFLGNRCPGGSYTYINNWLKEQGKEPLKYPAGLVKSVFDNSQKIGRTHLISETNIVKTSVITSHLSVTLDPNNNIQQDLQYQPRRWIWESIDEVKGSNIIDVLTKTSDGFHESRDMFISTCLNKVLKEHGRNSSDNIDSLVETGEDILCDSSNSNDSTISPYNAFSSHKSSLHPISCKAGEPDFLNPCSYDNIIQVIKSIGMRAGVKQYGTGDREWLMVECDGLPYNIIRDIIQNVFRCPKCTDCFYGISTYKDHTCYVLYRTNELREFGWLLPVFGLLHLEMNAARAFTKLNWEVFMSSLGNVLGFKSTKAQAYLQKGADHHKLWHLLEIAYVSLSMELMVPYVRHCLSKNAVPSVDGYWNWSGEIKDPNYRYIQESILNYAHSLMMLRAGIPIFFWRSNNKE